MKFVPTPSLSLSSFFSQDELQSSTKNSTVDSTASKWLGIEKLSGENSIFLTFVAHLSYVGLLSITNAILHYQQRKRFLEGQHINRPKVMFPRIAREDANKNLNALIKYVFNYAFYKFGVEVTFMAMLLLILIRADLVAVVYTIWIIALAVLPRNGKRYIWVIFQAFVVISASIQYIVILGMPPSMNTSELNLIFVEKLTISKNPLVELLTISNNLIIQAIRIYPSNSTTSKIYWHFKTTPENFCSTF